MFSENLQDNLGANFGCCSKFLIILSFEKIAA